MEGDRGIVRDQFLTPAELVARWRGTITLKTLENWRSTGKGPDFYRPARGVVLYRFSDVDAWEREVAFRQQSAT